MVSLTAKSSSLACTIIHIMKIIRLNNLDSLQQFIVTLRNIQG